MENNINGFYIEASEKAYKLLVKLGVDTKGVSCDHHIKTMGANTFLVHNNELKSTDGNPLNFKWFSNPKKVVLDDLKKIYRESDPDRTLDKFVTKLELKEVPSFEEYYKIFADLKKYLFKTKEEGLSIKFAFGLKDRIVEEFAFHKYDRMPDQDIKKHLEEKYSKIFKDDLKNCDHNKIISHPIYPTMIVDLAYISKKGKIESFKYLLDNINLNDFDVDMTVLAHAISHSKNSIVKEIVDYVNKGNKYDGSKGQFVYKIKEHINENLSNLDLDLQDKVANTFEGINKPKFDLNKAIASQNNSREEKLIDGYKKMFPGLDWDR